MNSTVVVLADSADGKPIKLALGTFAPVGDGTHRLIATAAPAPPPAPCPTCTAMASAPAPPAPVAYTPPTAPTPTARPTPQSTATVATPPSPPVQDGRLPEGVQWTANETLPAYTDLRPFRRIRLATDGRYYAFFDPCGDRTDEQLAAAKAIADGRSAVAVQVQRANAAALRARRSPVTASGTPSRGFAANPGAKALRAYPR